MPRALELISFFFLGHGPTYPISDLSGSAITRRNCTVFFAAKFTTVNLVLSIISAHVVSWCYSSNFIDISINIMFFFQLLHLYLYLFKASTKINSYSRYNRARRLSSYIPSTIRSRIRSSFKLPNSQVATN